MARKAIERPPQTPAMHPQDAVLVALGANLPGRAGAAPLENCIEALALMPRFGIEVLGRSRWYASAPLGETRQPDFVNAAARVGTDLPPEELLNALHRIEERLGRQRSYPNAPRVIDLDLIGYGRAMREPVPGDPSRLVLPHPRLHRRGFVLLPMADLVPGWRHPATGAGLSSLIAKLPPGQRCHPIE